MLGVVVVTVSVISMSILTVAIRIHFVGEEEVDSKKMMLALSVIFLYCAVELIVTFFCLLVIAVQLRLRMLSEVLRNHSENFDLKMLSSKHLICHLKALPMLYLKVYEISKNINWIYGLPMGFFLFFNLVSMTFAFFELYLALVYERTSAQLQFCTLTNLWSFFMTFYLSSLLT